MRTHILPSKPNRALSLHCRSGGPPEACPRGLSLWSAGRLFGSSSFKNSEGDQENRKCALEEGHSDQVAGTLEDLQLRRRRRLGFLGPTSAPRADL